MPFGANNIIRIGKSLVGPVRENLIVVIRQYWKVFAYTVEEMPGIPAEVASHHLDIKLGYKLIKQKLRHQDAERARAAKEEVDQLLRFGFIKQCKYLDWLANVVLVKKLSGKWRMCIDFTDLNKACLKDDYPLPKIDKLVDCWSCIIGLHGRQRRISPNFVSHRRQTTYRLHHFHRGILLHSDAFRPKECGGNLPMNGQQDIQGSDCAKSRSLR